MFVVAPFDQAVPLHALQHAADARRRHVQLVGELALTDAVVHAGDAQAEELPGMDPLAVADETADQPRVQAPRGDEGAKRVGRELIDAVFFEVR